MQRQFATSLLLAEVTKPEGGTNVVFGTPSRASPSSAMTIERHSSRDRLVERVRPSNDCPT
jgi:hypothetical protein